MNNLINMSPSEQKLWALIKQLVRYQKVEIKLDDTDQIVYTVTTNIRGSIDWQNGIFVLV